MGNPVSPRVSLHVVHGTGVPLQPSPVSPCHSDTVSAGVSIKCIGCKTTVPGNFSLQLFQFLPVRLQRSVKPALSFSLVTSISWNGGARHSHPGVRITSAANWGPAPFFNFFQNLCIVRKTSLSSQRQKGGS